MKVLICGLGSIAKKHIAALFNIDQKVEIYALRFSATNSETIAKVNNIYDINDVSNIEFDFAIISNPTAKHKETIERLIKYNIPLFIEKPLHYNLDMEELIEKINDKKILTYVACNLRFLEGLQHIKMQLSKHNKRINEVNVYCGSYLPAWREGDYRKQYSAIPALGGGVHIDLIHELDYIYWLWGMPLNKHTVFRNNSSLRIEAIDYANYWFDYGNFSVNVVLNYYRRDYKRTLEIVFEDDTWLFDIAKNRITSINNIIFESANGILDTYETQMRYFISLLKEDKPSFNTINDAYNTLKMAL